jgi:phage FluMu protein Com
MANLIELRCLCIGPNGRHPKLAEISGSDFKLKLRCPKCKRIVVFEFPHALGVKVTPQK